ncbi:unnamed protein product [Arabis nemorensis]|uniref:Uncharacterized protein n=1 Tax=Arabis nemorensis TaxID=586526 RepID=A0A565B1P3_9BRAS|nr:unnamed protein product [Arabis nemorensis]
MSMNLRKSMKRSFGEGDASKKADEEKKMSKILQKFEASCSIFNPPSEAVEDLKEKFIEFSLKEESMKEEKPWAVMNHRINKAQELLTKLRKDHPDTIHDCLFGCNEKEFYLADMNDTKKAISSLNDGNHQASTSDPATTDDVPAVTAPTAADDVLE